MGNSEWLDLAEQAEAADIPQVNRYEVLPPRLLFRNTLAALLARRIVVPETGCWIYAGARSEGYGSLRVEGRTFRAHRLAYTIWRGPIPNGKTLDHICRTRACFNPAHLEPVSFKENILRGAGPTAVNARKTHCQHGHLFTAENVYVYPRSGYRICRLCKREYQRERRKLQHA